MEERGSALACDPLMKVTSTGGDDSSVEDDAVPASEEGVMTRDFHQCENSFVTVRQNA